MLPVALLLTASTFTFAGGSEHELCIALEAISHQPVVMLCDPDRKLPHAQFEYETPKDVERLAALKLHLTERRKSWGFAPVGWPHGFYFKQNSWQTYNNKFGDEAAVEIKVEGDKLSIDTRGSAVTLSRLASELPNLRLSWHSFYDNARLAVCAKDCSAPDLLQVIASSLGASISTVSGKTRFDLGIGDYRSRTIQMCAMHSTKTYPQDRAMDEGDMHLISTLVQYFKDDRIRAYMDGDQTQYEYHAGHPIWKAAMERAKAYEYGMTPDATYLGTSMLPDAIKALDPQCDVTVSLRADGKADSNYRTGPHSWMGF